jgi:hypothetical protein
MLPIIDLEHQGMCLAMFGVVLDLIYLGRPEKFRVLINLGKGGLTEHRCP